MDNFLLPTITMVAGSTCPVSFRLSDFSNSAVVGTNIKGYFSISHYVPSIVGDPIWGSCEVVADADGQMRFIIPENITLTLFGKFIYQVHITDGTDHEIYQGYMVIYKNRNPSIFDSGADGTA